LDGGEGKSLVQVNVALAKKLSITGTPTFFIGRRHADGTLAVSHAIAGARPLAEFTELLEQLIEGR
jgi:protein-disulfide isomerase